MSKLDKTIGTLDGLNSILLGQIENGQLPKFAQDPTTAGAYGEPIPAEMVQQGATQMAPEPGAASGMPPGQQDPMMQIADMVAQIGQLLEQGMMQILEVLTRMDETNQRVEKQLVLMSGATLGQQATMAANPIVPPPPQPAGPGPAQSQKMARDEIELPAAQRDGQMAKLDSINSLGDTLRKTRNVFEAIRAIRASGE